MRRKFDYAFSLQYLGQYLSYYIQTWHAGRPIMAYNYAHACFEDLDLDARQRQTFSVELFRQLWNQQALHLLQR